GEVSVRDVVAELVAGQVRAGGPEASLDRGPRRVDTIPPPSRGRWPGHGPEGGSLGTDGTESPPRLSKPPSGSWRTHLSRKGRGTSFSPRRACADDAAVPAVGRAQLIGSRQRLGAVPRAVQHLHAVVVVHVPREPLAHPVLLHLHLQSGHAPEQPFER